MNTFGILISILIVLIPATSALAGLYARANPICFIPIAMEVSR
jgi:hypothetical protein